MPFVSLRAIGLDWRKAALASAIALTPDLDVLFHVHRSLTHSAVVVAAAVLALLAFTLLIPAGSRNAARSVIMLGAVGVATHLLLDLFGAYTPILWPFLNNSFWISTDIHFHIASLPVVTGSLELLTEPTVFQSFTSFNETVLTAEGLGVSLVLLIPSIAGAIRKTSKEHTPSISSISPVTEPEHAK